MPARINWLLMAIALVAGLVIGFAGSTLAYRYGVLRVPRHGILARMDRSLNLTPGQREQIAGVIEDTRTKVFGLRNDFIHQRHDALMQAYNQIRGLLTADQQKKFDKEFLPPAPHPHRRHRY